MAINDVKTLTLYTAVFLALGTLSAQGDANLNCQAYANAAVNHQQQNLKSKCGFKGGRWSLNYNGHQAWCKLGNVKMFNLTTEDKARTAALNNCKKKKNDNISGRKKELKCQVYASRAVKLTTQRNKACNKTSGKATNLDFRRYCMKVGPKFANKKNAKLQGQINACKNKVTTKGGSSFKVKYCKKAATATQGWRGALKEACKGTGLTTTGEWPATWKHDFADCMKHGGSWADFKNAERKKQASACTIKKRTKTFTNRDKLRKKTRYGWLSFDTCSNKGKYGKAGENLYNTCGKGWAEELCKRFGYNKVTKMGKPQPNDQRTAWNSAKADGPSTWWAGSNRICHGKCYHFTSITCTK